MNIAVLGSGNIGGTMGRIWAEAGHAVRFGVRDPEAKGAALGERFSEFDVTFQPVGEAVGEGEVVLLAVPPSAVSGIAAEHGAILDDRIILDATNDFSAEDMSGYLTLKNHASRAKVFRVFNSLGWENFANPEFDGIRADHFYCGPEDKSALTIVEGLITDVGLRPIRIGTLEKRHLLDNMTRLWATLAMEQDRGRHLAFKILSD
ncbi:MAG: NADPH-dependent F420 reductase [Anaerolineales bacterium]